MVRVNQVLLAGWAAMLIGLAAPHWFPDAGFVTALIERFVKIRSDEAGLVRAISHHAEMTAKAGGVVLLLAGQGAVLGRWLGAGSALGPLTAWAAGFGIGGLVVLGCGLAGLWFPQPVLAATTVAGLAGWFGPGGGTLRRTLRDAVAGLRRTARAAPVPAVITAVAGMVLWGLALGPDVSWDAVVYHLRVPSLYVQEHRIFHVPTHHFTAFPLGAEMHNGWLMLAGGLDRMGGGEACRLLHVWAAVAAALAARRIAMRLAPGVPAAGWWAAAGLLLCPLAGTIAVRTYNDFAQAGLAGVALVLLLERPRGGARLAGAALGGALAAKYTGIIPLAACAWLWWRLRPAPSLVAGAVLLPWMAKNWLLTGNPVSPFLHGIFRVAGSETDVQLSAYAASVGTMSFSPATAGAALVRLFRATPGESLTELLAIGAAASWLLGRPGAARRVVGGWLAFVAAGWALLTPDLRFFTAALPALAGLAGAGLGNLAQPAERRTAWARAQRSVVSYVLPLLCIPNLVRLPLEHVRLFDPLPFVLGRESAWEHAERSLYPAPFFGRVAAWGNAELPARARLLVLIDIKAHYLWRRTLHDFQYVHPGLFLRWLRGAGSVEGLQRKLRQEGITHLLIVHQRTRDVGDHYSWRGTELAQAAEFLARCTRPVAAAEQVQVLAVVPPQPDRRPVEAYDWILLTHPENLLQAGRDAEAEALLRATVAAAPWHDGARGYFGWALAKTGRPREAEPHLLAGMRAGGARAANFAVVLAQLRHGRKDFTGAIAASREAVRFNPRLAEARYNLGALLFLSGKWAEALPELKSAAELEPGHERFVGAYRQLAAKLEGR